MKNITLEIGDRTYSKAEPTVGDWYNHLDTVDRIKGKNLLADREAATDAVAYVAQFFGITADEIKAGVGLLPVITAYNQIQKNIIETFNEASAVWGKTEKNAKAPEK